MRARFVGPAAVAAAAVLAARGALANGRFPASNQIVFSPTNDDIIIGRATCAILPSSDNGRSWGYLCEDALALPAVTFQDPEIGVTSNNSIVAGLFSPTIGLDVSSDLGCNWSCIGGPLASQAIADIVVRPDSAPDGSALGSSSHQVLALTSTSGTADAGTSSEVFQSVDDGATWTVLGRPIDPSDPMLQVATIDVAASDPARIYVSANRGYALMRTASLFVSMDSGMTWTERVVPGFNSPVPCCNDPTTMCQSEDQLFIAGVDPTDENRVYLRSNGPAGALTPGNSILYVTKDGGQTFQIAKTFPLPQPNSEFQLSGEVLGFALSADGSKVYVGTKETGLWTASRTDLAFTNVNCKVQVQCLADRVLKSTGQEELWACSTELGGFIFGKSIDQGKTFTPMMPTITSMSGPVACSASGPTSSACLTDANASACSCSAYQLFCGMTEPINACSGCGQDGGGVPPLPDDGGGCDTSLDGSVSCPTDGGTEPTPAPKPRCGCTVVGGRGAAGGFAGWALVGVTLRRRRRGPRRNGRAGPHERPRHRWGYDGAGHADAPSTHPHPRSRRR
jgi:hypothetical protein